MDIVREVLDQSAADKLKTIPLSNDTICWYIKEMSDDILKHARMSFFKNALTDPCTSIAGGRESAALERIMRLQTE